MKDEPNDIMTVEEAAEMLRIPASSVYRLAQQRRIPAQKVGRHWRFYRPSLLNWIAGRASFDSKPTHPDKMDFS